MLEWITAPKKQSVLEVKLLPGDPAQEDTLIHIPYSKLIDSILADRSSAGAVPRFVPSAFGSLWGEARPGELIHSRRIQYVSGSRDRDIILEESEPKDGRQREALHCSFIDRIRTLLNQQDMQKDLDGARQQIRRMRFDLEAWLLRTG